MLTPILLNALFQFQTRVSTLPIVAIGGQTSCFQIGDKGLGAQGTRISRGLLVNKIHKPLSLQPLVTSLKIQKAHLAAPLGICITEAINTNISFLRLPPDLEKCDKGLRGWNDRSFMINQKIIFCMMRNKKERARYMFSLNKARYSATLLCSLGPRSEVLRQHSNQDFLNKPQPVTVLTTFTFSI